MSPEAEICDDIDSFVDSICKSGITPEMIIIDLPPRSNFGVIFSLRKSFPETVMMFVQNFFLHSDRMVAEYMGGILLKEYNTLIACYPHFILTEFISSGDLYFPQPPTRVLGKETSIKQVLNELDLWIWQRLPNMISSARGREMVMSWMLNGEPAAKIAIMTGRSRKLIYHYRWMTMHALNIKNYSRDFTSSLTVKA